mmetsp:Transcript_14904/g.21264  ORF Transcript_14904/g.21264 Transcript_14904/m.21264 type:complete len:315 (+) Transcript_14904:35-979(+)|eukprot:CAMPEP_0172423196 /NCGR_PEP_ID=MMETSP1064-20121228/14409_1 /TAXON_ID=202472 /ORGANISM="Aulacoseira subarctica , Strain CCAP 1002/5" /LENGTH=314 /DNA_ID=CAMNT_0013164427 /DNA_START=35 /DNA_END=979 /DNA_ORIENTATION=+
MTLFGRSASRAAASVLARRCSRFSPCLVSNSDVVRARSAVSSKASPPFAAVNRSFFGRAAAEPITATPSIGQALAKLAQDRPEMDVIRYHHKNFKWSFKHVEFFSDCLATGFLDQGLAPGDVVLSWLPSHFSEQHILQFACSKAGMILYSLDPAQAITDTEGAKASLAKALTITEANVLVTQEAGDEVHYAQLCKEVIPEIRIFSFDCGMPFISGYYPHLRFPIHTGFEIGENYGMVPLKQMLVPSGELNNFLGGSSISGSTPVCGELLIGSDGLPVKGKLLTNDEVVKDNVWPTVSSILNKQYIEVEGVGVIF